MPLAGVLYEIIFLWECYSIYSSLLSILDITTTYIIYMPAVL